MHYEKRLNIFVLIVTSILFIASGYVNNRSWPEVLQRQEYLLYRSQKTQF